MTLFTAVETDVCVVGGGPAGSAIAIQLARLGYQVYLVEKNVFPRSQIGESFPPSIIPIFDVLGVREQIESAGFFRPQKSLIYWSTPQPIWKSQPGEPGFQVDRGSFDRLLLETAKQAGVEILQPASAFTKYSQEDDLWAIYIHFQDEQKIIKSRFFVDATGKKSSQFGQRRYYNPPTLALYGYWRNTTFTGIESRIEAGENEWYWGAPLPNETFNAAIFLDQEQYKTITPTNREQFYCSLLKKTTLLNPCLDGYLEDFVRVVEASSYVTEEPISSNHIKVGAAAFAIDPLSSQGVQMAMVSGIQGAIAVHTILSEPEHTDIAIAFYTNKLQEIVERNQKTAAHFYTSQAIFPPSSFWQKRSQNTLNVEQEDSKFNTKLFELNSLVCLSKTAKLKLTPVIQGNVIRQVTALHHPYLDSPVAYLGNIEICLLLKELQTQKTVLELIQQWSQQYELLICYQVLQWFWFRHIIVNSN